MSCQSLDTPVWAWAQSTSVTMDALTLGHETANWVIAATRKLDKLGRLGPNWDSYGGLPLSPESRSVVVAVLRWLEREDLPTPAVVLGSAGNVQFEWRGKGKELDVDIRGGNQVEFMKLTPSGRIEEGQVSKNLEGRLRDLSQWFLHG